MTEKRVQFSTIVKNQFPGYVNEEYPLSQEFFSQYYKSVEYQGGPTDILQNIDEYVKLDNNANIIESTTLTRDVDLFDSEIFVFNTAGFPDSYGIIKINDEIITYTGKTNVSFTGCIRGFSGITSYHNSNNPEQLVFSDSEIDEHVANASVQNLSSLFLKEFFRKTKNQLAPGFENRSFYDNLSINPSQRIRLNQGLFVKQLKDFYKSKGTDYSFKILFKALFNENVEVIKPRDFLFRPSDSQYKLTKDIIVEKISGDPTDLRNSTIYQNEYDNIKKAYAPVTSVEKITSGISTSDYYKISLDGGYDRDIIVEGAVYGNFTIHPTTKVIGNVSAQSTFIDVDSTVGFPNSGELRVTYDDGSVGEVKYGSKSLTQFANCTNISKQILDTTKVGINTYVYGQSSVDGSEIKVRVTSVLNEFSPLQNTYYLGKGDLITINSLGDDATGAKVDTWLLNICPTYEVKDFSIVNTLNNTGIVTTSTPALFKIGDKATFINSNNEKISATVIDVKSDRSFSVIGQGNLPSNAKYNLRRDLLKTNSPSFSSASFINSNVQNVYNSPDGESVLVASPSIPHYSGQPLNPVNQKIVFSGSYPPAGLASTDVITLTTNTDHGLYSGDAVYYTPEKEIIEIPSEDENNFSTQEIILSSLGENIKEGIYFVKRINQTDVKLARSRSNIFNGIFVSINSDVNISSNTLEKYNLKGKTLESQKLLKEISNPINDGKNYKTLPGKTGILVNGVEILNYKSQDTIFYGGIEEIEVTSTGESYDIINPPILNISDEVGTGATGYCDVFGSLEEIRILDTGFDYIETPIIKITGGNGEGAVAEANMKLIDHDVSFNSEANSALVGVGTTISTIGFSTYHKFRNGEKVVYTTNGQQAISGLFDNSIYYAHVNDQYTIKLHRNQSDAISGINTVSLLSYGVGNHTIKSFDKKSILSSVRVINSGFGYQNKKRTSSVSGINTAIDTIQIKNHGFNDGEIIKYTSTVSTIDGLTSGEKYYVLKEDNDSFKLASVGTGSTVENYFYNIRQPINLSTVGVGTHIFNYPEIKVEVIGSVGISSVSDDDFKAVVQPVFRGSITSVHLESSGSGYGSGDVINFHRDPSFTLYSGQDCQLIPIVSNGKISEVLINNSGKSYFAPPNLEIVGGGSGAVLVPVLSPDGRINEVRVIESGAGYSPSSTFINVISPGKGANFRAKLQSWTVNNFVRHFNNISSDDGFLTEGNFGLQYSHLYAPRKLREILYSNDESGKTLFGNFDLKKSQSGEELDSTNHSPIIGWAYDGNPIYGPYGYEKKTGGSIKQLKSGYVEESSKKSNRPPSYPPGFFVEDFTYFNSSDDLVLDENNGRFCITPEFPNGVYAYFATLNLSPDSSGVFANYKRPNFPYIIGNSYYSKPIDSNFNRSLSQDSINLNATYWRRNTKSYEINKSTNSYDYLTIPNSLSQTTSIRYASPGSVQSVGVVTGGSNYKVNDRVIFNNEGTSGSGANAIVSIISGKPVSNISVATSSIFNTEFYPVGGNGDFLIFAENPHNYNTGDVVSISGVSTTNSLISGSYSAGIATNSTYILNVGVGSTAITGFVTYFSVSGNLLYPSLSENDILRIEQEQLRVLNVDQTNSRIRVLRAINGTVGVSHTSSTLIYQAQRRISVNVGYRTSFDNKINREIYFNPLESVALGNNYGVGIGTTISFSNPGFGVTQVYIPTKSIYLPNHGLKTGDRVTYLTNSGTPIGVSTNGISTSLSLSNNTVLYIAKVSNDLIGISTVQVGLGSTGNFVGVSATTFNDSTLFFTSTGSGDYHSFKTDYDNVLRATVSRNLVTVSTSQTHGLANNDLVRIDVNPSISTSYTIKYNDNSRRILINPKSFANVGVNTSTGEITIQNHGFYTGQKVLHTSASGFYGLKNNEVYYVVSIDKNRFKLSDTYENSIRRIPNYIGITSAYGGEISPINPPIQAYRNSTITFDLSDSSLSFVNQSNNYSAFELNFYKDKNFTEAYDTSESTAFFNVNKYGTVGVSSDARVVLSVNENTPNLYYKFDLVNTNSILPVKKEIVVDKLVPSYNEIIVQSSIFAGDHFVTVSSGTTFTYTLSQTPENVEYNSTTSSISYKTNSLSAYGGISSVRVKTGGLNYISLPGISTQLSSDLGTGAILEPSSSNIGALKTFRIDDIGFDFPSDFTIRPKPNLPKICKIDQLASFESIGVTSFGRGYTVAPKLIVLDGKTRQLVSEVDLKYTLGNSIVEIRKNTFGINNVRPTILPINNSNGVGISNISYNDTTKDVTVTLAVGFSTADSFPFAVNDRILIENISVGVGSTGKGFNSEDYGYSLFTVKSVAKNIGGIGIVTYSLDKFIKSGEYPGNFNATNSSGRIIPEKYLVKFDPILKVNKYLKNEIIKKEGFGEIGFVGNWDSNNAILRLNTDTNLKVGDVLEGKSSFTKGIIKKIDTFRSDYRIDYYSLVKNGWGTEIGFLSNNLQRIPDNDYYQNFSYSLKSRVDYDSWNDVVSSLNHTVGYKKFSDLQMESIVPQRDSRRMVVGIPTNVPSIEVTTDIIGYASLNCVYNFDLASENALVSNSNVFSDEIIFANRILTDYAESVGNRVLIIDDISGQFNSNPRPTKFSEVSRFSLGDARCKKYITYVQDKRYIGERQLMLVSLLYDNEGGTFINQYGRLETQYDLGSFDFYTSGSEGVLTFYPVKYTVNDYNVSSLSYNLQSTFSGIGSTNLGGSVLLNSSSTQINSGMVKTIVTTPLDYTSTKVILAITGNNGQYEFNELSLVHNGTSFEFLEYGQLTNYSLSSVPGLGTYYPYISGSNLKIDFTPTSGIGVTVNTLQVSIGNTSLSGVGTINFRDGKVSSSSVSAASTSSPVAIDVASYSDEYDAAYLILQVSDTTNNRHQVSEVIVIDDGSETYYSEFGTLETTIGLGTVGSYRSGNDTIVTFTPISGIDVEIKSFINGIRNPDDDLGDIFVNFNNSSIESDYGVYTGTETDIRRSFDLRHNNQKIFKRDFDGSNPDVVSVDENTVRIGSHFFVTGEELIYTHEGNPIGIVTTNFVGIGTTDKLPSTVFAIKVDDSNIKLASSAENALKTQPLFVDITSVGIGTSHSFTSKNQNQKVIIAIDNIIQSPLVATALTTSLERAALSVDDIIYFAGITSFFGGDLIKINNEVMRIDSVGIGSTNAIQVKRPWMGSVVSGHSTGSLVTKVTGSYNIIDNTINFVEAPYGNIPIGSTTNPPDERDWVGISTGSSFQGRTFLRSGIKDTSNETYYKNYVFDDISSGFNGLAKSFTLKSNRSDVSGIANENAIVLVNDIFQGPGLAYDYRLSENSGITTITFTGTASSVSYDPNNANIPVGGVIVSVGSTAGFGYQPLISAGGTVTVSSAGTISNISIGNSGSGYRSSSKYQIYTNTSNLTSIGSTIINIENKNSIFKVLEFNNTGSNCTVSIGTYVNSSLISVGGTFIAVGTANTSGYVIPSGTNVIISVNNPQIGIVNVSVGKTNVGISSLTHVGVATIYNGNVLSPVYVTNGGIGYTSGISTISNSPFAFFDAPLSYSNIPLVYSSSSSGVGTQATIDIVVGQGSSVIDFEVKNTGYGYGQNETLTIPVGGVVGIPTTSGFREFQLTIQKTANDKFTGWSVGELQVIDKLDNLFDGSRKIFPILIGGNLTSIRSSPGSNIDVQATLLIFINDILQVPGEGYIFNGGSNITFTEAPKPGDTSKIIFYKGSGSVDVVVKNIIETVKVGDGLILGYDPYQGQSEILQEEERVVTSINSIDNVNTNPYFGPGNSPDETLFRNIVWCRQTEDKIINEKIVGKERELYEPLVYPVANIIRSVGVGETVIYVENVRPLFNSINENDTSLLFQNSITLISQDNKVGASATAIVSVAGTITSIQITNGGSGYVTTPTVTIQDSVGIGTTTPVKATAIASITSGIVTSISISNPGAGYTTSNPPLVLIESPSVITETNSVNSYEGDFGIISGISTISVGVASTGLVFDFVIDKNSILRDSFITGFTSVSGISTGYYFVINNSNVGSGLTSLDSSNQIVGVGTQFIDNVYQVASVSIAQTSVVGLGLTYVAKVVVSVSNYNNLNGIGYSSYYGDYSWGKITLSSRNESQAFAAQTNNGYTGLSTGSLVSREIPLKSSNYIS